MGSNVCRHVPCHGPEERLKSGLKSRIKVEVQIALLRVAVPQLNLPVEVRSDCLLHEEIVDVVLEAVIGPQTVGIVMEGACTDREFVVEGGCDALRAKSALIAHKARALELNIVTFEQRSVFVEPWLEGAAARHEAEIRLGETWLHRIDVDVLQHLRLQQLADARNFQTRLANEGVGKEAMGRGVARIKHQGLITLVHGQLLKPEVVVDLRQVGSARSPVRIEQLLAAVDGAVVVELDGLLHAQHRVDWLVDAL